MNEYLVLVVELMAFSALSLAEAEIEGKYGGGGKNAKIFKIGPFRVRRYHFFMNFVVTPLFVLLALTVGGFDLKLLGVLVSGAFIGGLFQDFLWFVVNPNYGIKKFNSKDAYWLVWWKFGKFELPYFYILNPILAIIIWFAFVG